MDNYIKNSFAGFDDEFCISQTKTINNTRLELQDRLLRLKITEDDLETVFPTLESYCLRNYKSEGLKFPKLQSARIKALKSAQKSIDNLLPRLILPNEKHYYSEVANRLALDVERGTDTFEQVYGRRLDKQTKKSFQKGRKSNANQDIDIFHLVMLLERVLKGKKAKGQKGDSARNLALLFFNSVGFDSQSRKGQITPKIIKDAYRRGRDWLEDKFSKLSGPKTSLDK